MSENEMKEVIKNEVALAWETYKDYKYRYGIDSEKAKEAMMQWFSLDKLWNLLFQNEDY